MHFINGIINLNKPRGNTSFQMVSLVRKLTGIRKIGHSGTLDPDASGVLPIMIGKATRLAAFLTDSNKTYQAEITFGQSTSTYDSTGKTLQTASCSELTLAKIETALEGFRGAIEQVPPMYSAIKHQGQPLYRLARAGIEISRTPRQIHIFRLDVHNWQNPVLKLEIECSKGTYIRSLAHDLGQVLCCGAFLSNLIRTHAGPFHIEQAIPPSEIESRFREGTWQTLVHPLDTAISQLPTLVVDEKGEENLGYGRTIENAVEKGSVDTELRRAYSGDGRFLALVQFHEETGEWHPNKVFV